MLRIGITDDHTLFKESLKLLINSFGNMNVVIEAANGYELLKKLENTSIDILLLDLQMPEMNGIETCKKVKELSPETKVLILTLKDDKKTIHEVLNHEVDGYFTKNSDPSELHNAILKISKGGFYYEKKLELIIKDILDNPILEDSTERLIAFSERELEIIRLTLKEFSGSEIAEILYISPKTVEKHKSNIMKKTGSKNFIGIMVYALRNNFLSLNELHN